jgi:hypothetical protein
MLGLVSKAHFYTKYFYRTDEALGGKAVYVRTSQSNSSTDSIRNRLTRSSSTANTRVKCISSLNGEIISSYYFPYSLGI